MESCVRHNTRHRKKYRHLFQSAQALYDILIVGIFESYIVLKDRTIAIAEFVQCFAFHFLGNLCVESSRFYVILGNAIT